jgi:hypothetical protein
MGRRQRGGMGELVNYCARRPAAGALKFIQRASSERDAVGSENAGEQVANEKRVFLLTRSG